MLTETKTGKILIVDDEYEIALPLKEFLEYEGYSAFVASNGAVALDKLVNEKDYAVVLLDVNMPDLDGITVLKRLREGMCDTAVIMMSGHGSEEIAVECMRNGAEDYIAKPFALEDMHQRLERAMAHRLALIEKRKLQEEKEDFILMLSHDMKNPLTAVIGSIDIVREKCLGPINGEQEDYLQSAIDSCNEVVVMIDNLLDIRKFEAGKIQMAINSYNGNQLIRRIASQFARPAKHDGIELLVDLEDGSSEIAVDKSSFNRILGNLLGNAMKFTPEGGKISISSRTVSASMLQSLDIPVYTEFPSCFRENAFYYKITVSDTGNGIPADELNLIFDRYTQFKRKTDRERGGAGLGLAYCKLAIDKFGGIIWAKSEAGVGSEFVILLPSVSENSGVN
ncbi:MAG: hybrid sensor histidine kinase/response regulator [Desulfuromonadaceae bacterium]|nr:hybrid sensor histidine kinase/response regulator [Desulfuromonadaceae bacterium]MDD2855242.1 hybrid sensor histidine kinase/response regulator [Desulfuromonadaceae bacterium]